MDREAKERTVRDGAEREKNSSGSGRPSSGGRPQGHEGHSRNARPSGKKARPKNTSGSSGPARETVRPDGIRRAEPARSSRPGKHPSNSRKPGRKRSKKEKAAFDIGSTIVLIIAVCVFVFSLYKLITSLVPYYTSSKEYDKIRDLAITEDSDGKGFRVDFVVLLEQNPDTVGWIRFDQPEIINYPVVQGTDNDKYLVKTFTENDNKLGTIFVDYRNAGDFSDRNTFIYGHNMSVSGQMFSKLKDYKSEEFGKENPYFYIYTPSGEVRTYTIFSAGIVDATSDSYKIEYADDAEFEAYLDLCLEDSLYDFGVEVNADSQIVSLSTCTSVTENERFLVHGVLTDID